MDDDPCLIKLEKVLKHVNVLFKQYVSNPQVGRLVESLKQKAIKPGWGKYTFIQADGGILLNSKDQDKAFGGLSKENKIGATVENPSALFQELGSTVPQRVFGNELDLYCTRLPVNVVSSSTIL